jgi:hypothetical protein
VFCHNCGKRNAFETDSPVPFECSFCFEIITPEIEGSPSQSNQISDEGNESVTGLVLIYQKNQQRIRIGTSDRTFLGRKCSGAEVLAAILNRSGTPVISGTHCSIEFKDNNFYLRDEGSVNGTFYGARKISCKDSPQKIEPNSLLYLGQEPFVAIVVSEKPQLIEEGPNLDDRPTADLVAEAVSLYRCNETACGLETTENLKECPICFTRNSFYKISL